MLNGIWDEFLAVVREEAGSRVVETWLKAVVLKQWDSLNKKVWLQAPNTFVKEWVSAHYSELIRLHLSRLFNVDALDIVFVDGTMPATSSVTVMPAIVEQSSQKSAHIVAPASLQTTSQHAPLVRVTASRRGLNDTYWFSNFVVGPSNSLAYAAAQAVTQQPGVLYNPLFIYGGSGLGKTHLLHAIGNEISRLRTNVVVLYQTADRFVNEFINAIRFNKIHTFREKYKDVDVLLIDDIQFISNKEQTQEAFFHIFNSLHEHHKQIVFSSDTYPSDIAGLAERLRSRLEWGLVTDICAPLLETKIAILKKKMEQGTTTVPDDVIEFIAEGAGSNIRDLEGAYIRVVAFASLTRQPVSIELAAKVLARPIAERMAGDVNLDRIARQVSKQYGVTLVALRSSGRNKELVVPRQVAMYLMKNMTNKSLSDIGLFFNRKDHSTVLHAVTKVRELRKHDGEFDRMIAQCERELRIQ